MDYPGKVITKNQVTPTQISATGVWTLDDAAAATRNNNWPVAGVPNPISKSLRFNTPDAAYLNRTPASASNRKTWTWSGWVKRSAIGSGVQQGLIGCSSGTTDSTFMNFQFTGDRLGLGLYTQYILLTTQLFRDVGAWYHIVVALDTTNATADNRCRMYINGVEVTVFTTRNNPTLNADYGINQATQHDIGRAEYTNSTCMGGYMTEINFIDGQALTPSSFGMTDPVTGVWEPLKYSGTYGTNGFYLNFKDATSTTTLGLDYSGNANNWTTNNFSVTAGSGNDSLTDVPTPWIVYNTTGDIGGVVRGNYCTLNPLASVSSPPTFANGNLEATGPASGVGVCQTTAAATSGKFYAEVTVTRTSDRLDLGIMGSGVSMTTTNYLGTDTNTIAYLTSTGVIRKDNTNNQTGLATCTTGDVVGMTVDMDTGSIQFYKNNATVGTAVSFTPSSYVAFLFAQTTSNNTSKGTWNFGQRPFAYTPPSGFRSLCTTNLPASTILKGSQYMNAVLYTGNGSTQSITGVGFQPDLVWAKCRSNSYHHKLVDAVRGVTLTLSSSQTSAEQTEANSLTAFNSDGFSLGNISSMNASAETYVAWNWKANGAGVTNTAGTITSSVSANTTSGFSIVTYTGTGSAATFGHGLGVTPAMYIVKIRNGANNWVVWHNKLANTTTSYILLDSTAAETTSASIWGSTAATSTTIGVGTAAATNANASTYVAYCFAPISGYSAFGSYTGNGSADGPFVYTGFRPRWVMVKQATVSARDWIILDTARNTYNVADLQLMPNKSDAEATTVLSSTAYLDILSNGFKIRNTSVRNNESSATYIFAAFAENPFKNALAR